MFLVAGLAVAVVAGILAAVYVSIRSGKRGGKRLRPAGAGGIGTDRAAASRPGAIRRPSGRVGGAAKTGGQTEFALRASGPARPAAGNRPARAQVSTLTESWPAAPSDLDDPPAGDAWPDDAWSADAWPGDSTAADPGPRAASPGTGPLQPGQPGRHGTGQPGTGVSRDARPRRRVGFRKGADIDEELWPAESFGGVSDEQFWDDMASDKPLTTTARTAQQEAGPRSQLLDTGSDTDPQGTQALGVDRSGPEKARTGPGRTGQGRAGQSQTGEGRPGEGRPGEGRRSAGYGAYPGPRTGQDPRSAPAPRTGPDPRTGQDLSAERTVVQPAYAATQPVKSMTPPAPATPPPSRGATQPARSATPPGATQPARTPAAAGPSGPSGPSGIAGQPRAASASPGETARRRRPSSSEDDPLTSASFSLRPRGPVDGRSSLRPRDQQDAPRERDAASSGPGRGTASPYGHTAPYPPAGTSYDDASSVTQMMSTPPNGENYGSGNQADHPRRRNGARSHAQPGGTGEQPRPPRPAYPQDVRQASGSYPAGGYPGNGHHGHGYQSGSYPGNGAAGSPSSGSGQLDGGRLGSGSQNGSYPGSGYPGSGYPGDGTRGTGHRAPRDPRDDYRRLTHRRLPGRLGSCPRETWSGRPPAACTRRWRGGR